MYFSGSRRHGIAPVEGIQKKIKDKAKAKRKKRELVNFWNFQMRESKKERKLREPITPILS